MWSPLQRRLANSRKESLSSPIRMERLYLDLGLTTQGGILQCPFVCIGLTCEEEADVVALLGIARCSVVLRLHGVVKHFFGGLDLTLQVACDVVGRFAFLLLSERRRRIVVATFAEGLDPSKGHTGCQTEFLDALAVV